MVNSLAKKAKRQPSQAVPAPEKIVKRPYWFRNGTEKPPFSFLYGGSRDELK
jgi:hypothetical protein